MSTVKFVKTTSEKYKELGINVDLSTIYYCTDTEQVFVGDYDFSKSVTILDTDPISNGLSGDYGKLYVFEDNLYTCLNNADGSMTRWLQIGNNYEHPTGNGHNHIPVDGNSSDQLLSWSDIGTAKWSNFNDVIPVIRDVAGTPNLDSAVTPGRYMYIGDTGVVCQLQVSTCEAEYMGTMVTAVLQLLLKPRMNPEEELDNLGHGLKVYGLFIRSGYQMGEEFIWESDFEKVNTNDNYVVKPDDDISSEERKFYMLYRQNKDDHDQFFWSTCALVPSYNGTEDNKILIYDSTFYNLCRWGNLFTEYPNIPKTDAENTFSKNQAVLGDLNITGNITVSGNVYQEGSSYETHAEQMYTKDDYIILRDGAESGLAPVIPGDATQTGQFAGFEAKNYDGTTDGRLVFDNTGTARVGDKGGEQPLATRAEVSEIPDGTLLRWDAQNLRLVSTGLKINAELTKSQYDALPNKDPNTLYLLREG